MNQAAAEPTLYRVTTPTYCAGLIVKQGKVIRSAPILKWTLGKPITQVTKVWNSKNFWWEPLP